MMRLVVIIYMAIAACVSCKGNLQKKGLVVEVQSHQQALKYANPITDLEQTISRGINDPYTDPRFVMNQINEEFFGSSLKNNLNAGTPFAENNLHNRELMAFRNLPMNVQGSLAMNSLPEGSLPSNSITQHAIKENNVPFRQPAQSIDQALSKLLLFKNSMAAKKHVARGKQQSLLPPMAIPKMAKDMTLPSDLRIAHLSSDAIHPSTPKQEASSGRSFAEINEPSIGANDASSQNFIESDKKAAATINIGNEPQNIGDTLSSMIEKSGSKSNDILAANPGSISGKEMDENFSSIKAFIEADEDLRDKKVIDPVRNPLEDLLHSKRKKHTVPKGRKMLRKVIASK